MELVELLSRLGPADEEKVIVAKPPLTWGCDARTVALTGDYRVPQDVLDEGFVYLMGVEDVRDLIQSVASKKISTKSLAEFIIHNGVVDAPPAWIDDIPNK
jgi:hypothetical protein